MSKPNSVPGDLVRLKPMLRSLKLPTIWAECEKVARQCASERVDHLGYLSRVCELEMIERERKAAARRLKGARFPAVKTLGEFAFAAQAVIPEILLHDLSRCHYIDKRENVLFVGASGTGKTHLATSLAVEACQRGKRVRFVRVTELITSLLEARDQHQLARLKGQLSKLDLLVLDELGYVPASKVGAELLFDVISTSYERTSLIVTTNLPFERWTEVLLDASLTAAALDRLTHRCHIVETGSESYRLKEAKRRHAAPDGLNRARRASSTDLVNESRVAERSSPVDDPSSNR
ncbi:DNA replication protein DnaC [Singulisphaera sp. GP187]|uniref:IS21-like element helper ATPase IstB n=1 Tax=Singulisphaera sp. GP187 TaxID=1882752 RepID=UPI00092B7841|nr:IS21-like element helper ATPase IstB [Singulisphaera sp. GP187]SIO57938.1 DNA replication protein DnaC [Singulisphaera sp. GP187]